MDKRLAARRMRRESAGREGGDGQENGDGGRCHEGVITWRQNDSIVDVGLEAAVQYRARGS